MDFNLTKNSIQSRIRIIDLDEPLRTDQTAGTSVELSDGVSSSCACIERRKRSREKRIDNVKNANFISFYRF